jgi:hypothetical protein
MMRKCFLRSLDHFLKGEGIDPFLKKINNVKGSILFVLSVLVHHRSGLKVQGQIVRERKLHSTAYLVLTYCTVHMDWLCTVIVLFSDLL